MLVKVIVNSVNIDGAMYKKGDILDIPCHMFSGLANRDIVKKVKTETPKSSCCSGNDSTGARFLQNEIDEVTAMIKGEHCGDILGPIEVKLRPMNKTRPTSDCKKSWSAKFNSAVRYDESLCETPQGYQWDEGCGNTYYKHRTVHDPSSGLDPECNDSNYNKSTNRKNYVKKIASAPKRTVCCTKVETDAAVVSRCAETIAPGSIDSRSVVSSVDIGYCGTGRESHCGSDSSEYKVTRSWDFDMEYPVGDVADVNLCLSMEVDKLNRLRMNKFR